MEDMDQEFYHCYYEKCPRVYSSKYNLRRHVNSTHLRIRSFACEKCGKKFTSKQSLKEHFYIHTGEKPFTCYEDGCNKDFRQASQLNVHRRKVHKLSDFITVKRSEANVKHPFDFECEISETINISLNQRDLPTVDQVRSSHQAFKKLPVLPILLDSLKA